MQCEQIHSAKRQTNRIQCSKPSQTKPTIANEVHTKRLQAPQNIPFKAEFYGTCIFRLLRRLKEQKSIASSELIASDIYEKTRKRKKCLCWNWWLHSDMQKSNISISLGNGRENLFFCCRFIRWNFLFDFFFYLNCYGKLFFHWKYECEFIFSRSVSDSLSQNASWINHFEFNGKFVWKNHIVTWTKTNL